MASISEMVAKAKAMGMSALDTPAGEGIKDVGRGMKKAGKFVKGVAGQLKDDAKTLMKDNTPDDMSKMDHKSMMEPDKDDKTKG